MLSGFEMFKLLVSDHLNRLPERSGDARNFERNKASPQHLIRPVGPEQSTQLKASGLCETPRSEQGTEEY